MEEREEIQDSRIEDLENYNRAMTIRATNIATSSTIMENSSRSSSINIGL